MKIILKFICLTIFLSLFAMMSQTNFIIKANAQTNEQYARVKNVNTYLFKNPTFSTDLNNIYFILEETYFVKLITVENETFYKAQYITTIGYVKKTDVELVKGNPIKPFANTNYLRAYAENGLNLRETPEMITTGSNIIALVPYNETNIQYYGRIEGNEISNGNLYWYYCKYTTNSSSYFGYLYSGYFYNVVQITPNIESLEIISPYEFERISSGESEISVRNINSLSTGVQTLIIVGVSLPALFIIYLLFKPTKIIETTAKSTDENIFKITTKKRKKKHKGDYYEYEE